MGLVCCVQGNRCVDEAGIVVATVRSGNAATLGAAFVARPPRGSRGVRASSSERVNLSLLSADDSALKGVPGLALLGAQHLEHTIGRPLPVEIMESLSLCLMNGRMMIALAQQVIVSRGPSRDHALACPVGAILGARC